MLKAIISLSLKHKMMVILIALLCVVLGIKAVKETPLDAIPDLSDIQVIVKTSYPGQAAELIEQQVTFPLATSLMAVPKAKTVRGFSFFGDSYVYIIFEDNTDLYWARSRVLEYLSQVAAQLPPEAKPVLGPDASGVGWIYQYALSDPSGQHNLAQLKSLQDWFLKFELQSVAGVSEVATVGGMEQTYQVVLEPLRLMQYGLTLQQVKQAIEQANQEVGGSVLEMAEAEYMVRSQGYLKSLADFKTIPLGITSEQGTPLLLEHVATIRLGPQMRRGIAELNGEGEVVGGIVVMRHGENALTTIAGVKAKLNSLKASLPDGVVITEVYDRSLLIERSVTTLQTKLIEEMLVVVLVCFIFLLHVRSTLVAVICLPLAVLMGFIAMKAMGINANIMSLGGIAIAIGALVDAAIVMVENLHKHLDEFQQQHGRSAKGAEHWQLVQTASIEVGPALFLSLLLITLSFIPVFALEAQEGKLFAPLAYTKTFVMAAAALLSITLVPVLMGFLVKGKIPTESANPINRGLITIYKPILRVCLKAPWTVVVVALFIGASSYYPLIKMGAEFMPELDEGDLLYMPTTLPGVSIAQAGAILQQTDRLIKTQPEVASVFGKVGRAETATDPAPLTMLETTIALKPKSEWREGITLDDIIAELDSKIKFPGLTNAWVQPIKTRIDMLSTGVKTPVGIKISGADLAVIEQIGQQIEAILAPLSATSSVYSERAQSGRYIDIVPRRADAAKYGLSINDIQVIIKFALGGANIGESIQGTERYPINLRYPRRYRDQIESLATLPFVTPSGAWVTLEQVADIVIKDGPALIKSENGRTIAWTFIDIKSDVSLGDYISTAQTALDKQLVLPAKYTISFAGQYEYMQRVEAKLLYVIPITLLIIFVILHLAFGSVTQALLVMLTLPVALAGSVWFVYWLDYQLSVALAVGMIALAGVAAEFGVVMLIYLNQAWQKNAGQLVLAIEQGAVQRVRPKAMTVLTIIAGLLPIMLGAGTGNEVMQKIAAPMLGGMILSPLVSMLLIPIGFYLLKRRQRL
ncbi:efflux RND transporter permease subunit [Pseudoalteromonas tunicata]|uniref:efflux RND transporter permease subunit n=1 Tax=Pseudoalteromonas tunicata TaxID=314281 RepID=UPI00273F41B3|nr:CusA/CzcA family heavy metal efflux RND transporter [Pseudoalteromonas tunicata]MDP4985820.1 CusA/CzcA family heavy metal efflux RND transporter [Pseudoalteromonas tunicata]